MLDNTTITQDVASRLESLLRRALDPGAPEPEALSSAAFFVRTARRASFGFNQLPKILPASAIQTAKPIERPYAWSYTMRFGKHRYKSLGEIVQVDPEYVAWLAIEFSNPLVRTFAAEVLDYVKGGGK